MTARAVNAFDRHVIYARLNRICSTHGSSAPFYFLSFFSVARLSLAATFIIDACRSIRPESVSCPLDDSSVRPSVDLSVSCGDRQSGGAG